jgi:UDP-N-acetylmuramoyl-tripeptide--D-alanyl-D-alanine ligase
MPPQTRYGVFEIGMNHAGEITPLVALVKPHVAIVTTVGPVHLEAFNSVDEIADAKAEIFTGLVENGVAIVHRDIPQFERLRDHARHAGVKQVLSFGAHEASDARLEKAELVAGAQIVSAWILGTHVRYRLGAPGRHMALNSLAVILAARALGVDMLDAARALARFEPPVGRGQRMKLLSPKGVFTLIDESYNANPASMRAAIALLAQENPTGRRIAALGDMLELGPQSADLHRGLADAIAENSVDLVFACGPMMRELYDELPTTRRGAWCATAAELTETLAEAIGGGDAVMVKGSNGSRMGPMVAAFRKRFSLSNETTT